MPAESVEWLAERILIAAERLKEAQIEQLPAIELISRYRYREVLIYADPPYSLSTRSKRQYADEMTDADHLELLDALDNHPGPVLVSGYGCDLYDERLRCWDRYESQACAQNGKRRVEVLWLNRVAASTLSPQNLVLFDETEGGIGASGPRITLIRILI